MVKTRKNEKKHYISGLKVTQDCVKMDLYEVWHISPANVKFFPENPGHSIKKVKLLLCIINHHIMKTKGILEVFLSLTVDGSKQSASCSNYFIPRRTALCIHCMDARASLVVWMFRTRELPRADQNQTTNP